MSISVNQHQQVIITDSEANFEFAASQGQTISDNNYGELLSVSYENGNYVVQTDKGTLTFNPDSPSLEAAKTAFSPFEIANTGFEEFDGFNWLEIAALVLEAEKLRNKTNRLARQLEGETAFNQAMNAAKELKDAARFRASSQSPAER